MLFLLKNFHRPKKSRRGFTLIELLIVIAIILILIAIALPNFLEAQIRARVVKAKGEIRSLGIALESYALDYDIYPAEHERNGGGNRNLRGLFWLTSPNAYITAIPEDPFHVFSEDEGIGYITYEFGGLENGGSFPSEPCPACQVTWALFSNGPDATQNIWQENPHFNRGQPTWNYSPTNGTKSTGEIFKWGGDPLFIGYSVTSVLVGKKLINSMPAVGLSVDGEYYLRRLPPSP
ncbi:MAG: prepilin-type N-terminal cleavage/methylation domain-containing protein [Candidatus Omnitrophica bacterium]|nr:prepilin-type N-terminal cleavage/methylation domain-containing protein [Candidatus Omnitrophota bacterium]